MNKIQNMVTAGQASLLDMKQGSGGAVFHRDFAPWHFPMVNDRKRNETIEKAVEKSNPRGKIVVEIGTGVGLVALLFAKHGAERVVTCEMNHNLASTASEIISKTPYSTRIEVIYASSTEAIAHGLLPFNPDIIFTETLDCGVVGEGFVQIARDIAKLAGPETNIMPVNVRQRAIVVDSSAIADLNRTSAVCGFDLQALNRYSTRNYFPVHSELHKHRYLTESQIVRDYRYVGGHEAELVPVTALENGTAHGLLSWFEANFGGATVTNEPFSKSHWHQAFHPLQNEISVRAGQELNLCIDDGGFASILPS